MDVVLHAGVLLGGKGEVVEKKSFEPLTPALKLRERANATHGI